MKFFNKYTLASSLFVGIQISTIGNVFAATISCIAMSGGTCPPLSITMAGTTIATKDKISKLSPIQKEALKKYPSLKLKNPGQLPTAYAAVDAQIKSNSTIDSKAVCSANFNIINKYLNTSMTFYGQQITNRYHYAERQSYIAKSNQGDGSNIKAVASDYLNAISKSTSTKSAADTAALKSYIDKYNSLTDKYIKDRLDNINSRYSGWNSDAKSYSDEATKIRNDMRAALLADIDAVQSACKSSTVGAPVASQVPAVTQADSLATSTVGGEDDGSLPKVGCDNDLETCDNSSANVNVDPASITIVKPPVSASSSVDDSLKKLISDKKTFADKLTTVYSKYFATTGTIHKNYDPKFKAAGDLTTKYNSSITALNKTNAALIKKLKTEHAADLLALSRKHAQQQCEGWTNTFNANPTYGRMYCVFDKATYTQLKYFPGIQHVCYIFSDNSESETIYTYATDSKSPKLDRYIWSQQDKDIHVSFTKPLKCAKNYPQQDNVISTVFPTPKVVAKKF